MKKNFENIWTFVVDRFTGRNAKNFVVQDKIMTRANMVTMAGIVLTTIYLFQYSLGFLLILIPVTVPLIVFSDAADGFLADYYNEHSVYGKVMDPIRDRYFTAVLLGNICMIGGLETVFPIAVLVISELCLALFYREVYLLTGKVLEAHWLGKTRSALQWLLSYLILVQFYWLGTTYVSPTLLVYLMAGLSMVVYLYNIVFRKY